MVMGHEYVLIAKLRHLCSTIDTRHWKQVKTDCVLFQGIAKKNLHVLQKATEQRYEDGSPVYRLISDDLKPLLASCERMPMEARLPEELPPWEAIAADELEQHVIGGRSVLIIGNPGTGKTFIARRLVGRLREAGKLVEIVSKTHASVQNIGLGAKTADHWTRRHIRNGATSCDTLVVEEITQIDVFLWCEIAKLLHKGTQFILLGDTRQFSAICASWSTSPLPDDALKKSDLLFELAGGFRTELTENRRSDPTISEFMKRLGVDETSGKPKHEALAEAKRIFPRTSHQPDYTLVISHRRRIAINRERNEADKPQDAIKIEVTTKHQVDNNAPQTMWLWPGLRLIGAGHKVPKGIFVEVKACDNEKVTLDNDLVLTHAQVCQSLRLSYAITYASCQGLTLRGRLLLETQTPFLTTRHLYVGISRGTASELVEVV